MNNVLILGANGRLARNTTRFFLDHSDARLTLYLRRANRLSNPDPVRVEIVEGDVLDQPTLQAAMRWQDAVYANLAGPMAQQAKTIVQAMHVTGLKRLILISSMGIYGEAPGAPYAGVLDPYRGSAAVIEASGPGLHPRPPRLVHPRQGSRLPDRPSAASARPRRCSTSARARTSCPIAK